MNREKGVATAPCPSCGRDLPLTEQPDGGLATEACSKCYPKATKSAEKAAAKQAVSGRETGTNVNKED